MMPSISTLQILEGFFYLYAHLDIGLHPMNTTVAHVVLLTLWDEDEVILWSFLNLSLQLLIEIFLLFNLCLVSQGIHL